MFIPFQVLLHRSAGDEGRFLSVKSSEFDQDLFLLSWGPTVAALSYVFDKADEKSIVQRAVDGFRYYMCKWIAKFLKSKIILLLNIRARLVLIPTVFNIPKKNKNL
jgi:hypothetical protein